MLETADNILDLYSGIDTQVPWVELNATVPYIDQYSDDYYTPLSASFVSYIKMNLLNAIQEYLESSTRISGWCSLSVPLLSAHTKLFTSHSASKAKAQNGILHLMLNDGVHKLKMTQNELAIISMSFNEIIETLTALYKQFEIDFDEKSTFFQKKLSENCRKANCMLPNAFGAKKQKAVNELKEELAIVSQFYINLKHLINQASLSITEIEIALKKQVRNIQKLKKESEDLIAFESIADNAELIEQIVNVTQNLITKCTEYDRRHQAF